MTRSRPGKLAQRALNFTSAIAEISARARQPGFSADAWQALAPGVAIDQFRYVGRAKEVLPWRDFLKQLDRRMRACELAVKIERVEESGNLVFLQLEERSASADAIRQLTTMTIFEFNAEGLLHRIDSFQ